ncbi:MAG: DUF167 family protein [Candidatus Paceibacterota bacterium]|jgi:uncharacterized protein (TIGR00251 family)
MYLKIHTYPGSREERVEKVSSDTFEIYLREKAEKGRANRRMLEILRNIYPKKKVILVAGHLSSHKVVAIDDR